MPKALPTALNTGHQIPQPILDLIARFAPEQRALIINRLRQKLLAGPEAVSEFCHALLRQQQQQQQNRIAMANQFGLNPSLAQSGPMADPSGPNITSMMGTNVNGLNGMGLMGNVTNMIPNVPHAGIGGGPTMNFNHDVLQSFMQRNNSDGNGPGLGSS